MLFLEIGGEQSVKVKAIIRFRDMETDVIREPNDIFSVSDERGEKLMKLGYVTKVNQKEKTAAE